MHFDVTNPKGDGHARESYYPGCASEAEYRAALAKKSAAKAAHDGANDTRFDAAVRRLKPIISEMREDTARRSTRKLTERLNVMGQVGPNGKPITPSTMPNPSAYA